MNSLKFQVWLNILSTSTIPQFKSKISFFFTKTKAQLKNCNHLIYSAQIKKPEIVFSNNRFQSIFFSFPLIIQRLLNFFLNFFLLLKYIFFLIAKYFLNFLFLFSFPFYDDNLYKYHKDVINWYFLINICITFFLFHFISFCLSFFLLLINYNAFLFYVFSTLQILLLNK